MTAHVTVYPDAIAALATGREIADLVQRLVDEGVEAAKALAPVGHTGDYRDGLRGDVAVVDGEIRGRVAGTDFKSVWVEFGTAAHPARPTATPAYRVLGRAMDQLSI